MRHALEAGALLQTTSGTHGEPRGAPTTGLVERGESFPGLPRIADRHGQQSRGPPNVGERIRARAAAASLSPYRSTNAEGPRRSPSLPCPPRRLRSTPRGHRNSNARPAANPLRNCPGKARVHSESCIIPVGRAADMPMDCADPVFPTAATRQVPAEGPPSDGNDYLRFVPFHRHVQAAGGLGTLRGGCRMWWRMILDPLPL